MPRRFRLGAKISPRGCAILLRQGGAPILSSARLADLGTANGAFHSDANIELYRRLLPENKFDPSRNEARHQTLLRLLAEELAKHVKPKDKRGRA